MGHRGAAALAPENTLEGLRTAARIGVRAVEFDVKLTQDGVPILMHDDTLQRTTDGEGRVAATRFEAIARLDAGAWFAPEFSGARVPRLADALRLVLDLGLAANMEIKASPGEEEATARAAGEVVRRLWPKDREPPLVSSFARASLRASAPGLPRALLLLERPPDWMAAKEMGCVALNCADRSLTPGWARDIKQAGLALAAFTVNDPGRAAELYGWGVDCIITDRPDAILPVARARSDQIESI